jgi:uncharacterized protein with GYD domain
MTTFITQARFTKDGLKGMVASPEDRAEVVGRLIGEVGGKLISYYMTSGDYDVLLIFEAASYEDVVPALIVAAAGGGVADLKTVTALKSSDMKSAFTKAGSIALSYRPPAVPAVNSAVPEQKMAAPTPDSQNGEAPDETQDEAKTAANILEGRRKAMEDTKAGRPAPYYFGSSPPSTSSRRKKPSTDPAKK